MEQKQLVTLKNSADRLLLIMDGDADFSAIAENLKAKIKGSQHFFKGVSMKLKYSGKELTPSQEKIIAALFTQLGEMDVIDIAPEITVPQRPEGNPFRGIAYGLFDQTPEGSEARPVRKAKGIFQVAEGLTSYYYGNLKKGQRIVYKGSVVIFGNVEKGAEVVASENLMVFGTVKGAVSVGGKHLKTAVLICERYTAEALEIAQIQRTVPDFSDKIKAVQKTGLFRRQRPEMKMLYLAENRITVATLSGL